MRPLIRCSEDFAWDVQMGGSINENESREDGSKVKANGPSPSTFLADQSDILETILFGFMEICNLELIPFLKYDTDVNKKACFKVQTVQKITNIAFNL